MPCKLLACIADGYKTRLKLCPHCDQHLVAAEYAKHEQLYLCDGVWTKTYISTNPLPEKQAAVPDMRAETATTIPGLDQQKASVKIHPRKVNPFDKVEISGPLPTLQRYIVTQKPLAPVHTAVHETIDQNNEHAFQFRQRREDPEQIYMQLPDIVKSGARSELPAPTAEAPYLSPLHASQPKTHETPKPPPAQLSHVPRKCQTIPKVETQIQTVETPDIHVRPSVPVNTPPSYNTPARPTTPPARRFHLSPMCQSTPKGRVAGKPLVTIPTTLPYGPLRVAPVQPRSSAASKLQINVASLTPTEPRRRIPNIRLKPFTTAEPQRVSELQNTKSPRSVERKSPMYYDDEGAETSVDEDQESVVYEANTIPTEIDFSNISLDEDSVPICNSTYADDIQSESTIAFNVADERPSISGASSPDSSASGDDESTILSPRARSDIQCTFSAHANKDNTSTTSSWASSHVFMSTDDSSVHSCMFWTFSDSDDSLEFTNQDNSMRKLPSDDETSIDTMTPTFLKEQSLTTSDDRLLIVTTEDFEISSPVDDLERLRSTSENNETMEMCSSPDIIPNPEIPNDSEPLNMPDTYDAKQSETNVMNIYNDDDIETRVQTVDSVALDSLSHSVNIPSDYMVSYPSLPYMPDNTSYFMGDRRGMNSSVDGLSLASSSHSRVYRVLHRYGSSSEDASTDHESDVGNFGSSANTATAQPKFPISQDYVLSPDNVPVPANPTERPVQKVGFSTGIDAVMAKLQSRGSNHEVIDGLSISGQVNVYSTDIDAVLAQLHRQEAQMCTDFSAVPDYGLSTDIDVIIAKLELTERPVPAPQEADDSSDIDAIFVSATSNEPIQTYVSPDHCEFDQSTKDYVSPMRHEVTEDEINSNHIPPVHLIETNDVTNVVPEYTIPVTIEKINIHPRAEPTEDVSTNIDEVEHIISCGPGPLNTVHSSFLNTHHLNIPGGENSCIVQSPLNIAESTRRETPVAPSKRPSKMDEPSPLTDSYLRCVWRAAVEKADNEAVKNISGDFETTGETSVTMETDSEINTSLFVHVYETLDYETESIGMEVHIDTESADFDDISVTIFFDDADIDYSTDANDDSAISTHP